MSLRANEAAPLLFWLTQQLTDAVLQEIRQPMRDRIVLSLRRPGQTHHLLLVCGSPLARIHSLKRPPPNPKRAFPFQGLLRKELRGRLLSMNTIQGDRILRLDFGSQDSVQRSLIADYRGNRGALILLDDKDTILGVTPSRRDLEPRSIWIPPNPPSFSGKDLDRFKGLESKERDEAAQDFFEEEERRREETARQNDAMAQLRRKRRSLLRLTSALEADVERAQQAASLREEAILLQSSFHLLRRGMDRIELKDFHQPNTPLRSVRLDPRLKPQEQVDKRFHRAKRAERAGSLARDRLMKAHQDLQLVSRCLERASELDNSQMLAELSALPEGLAPAILPNRPAGNTARPPKNKRQKSARRMPYRSYRLPGGTEVWVGRGAADNDALTIRYAAGNDVWMHVRGRPGAHVVLRAPGKSPSPQLLLLGAQVAMAHSGLSEGTKAEVAWTRAKHVKKPKGFPPGKVLVTQERVLYVKAERAQLEGLEPMEAPSGKTKTPKDR